MNGISAIHSRVAAIEARFILDRLEDHVAAVTSYASNLILLARVADGPMALALDRLGTDLSSTAGQMEEARQELCDLP